jgi:hypothetical protein
LNRLAAAEATNWRFFYRRGNTLAELGQLRAASADFARAIELGAPDVEVLAACAIAQLRLGDVDAYLATRARFLARASLDPTPAMTQALARVSLLYPDAEAPSDWANLIARLTAVQPRSSYSSSLLAPAHFRSGDTEQALRLLPRQRVADALRLRAQAAAVADWLWTSLAHGRAGRTAESKSWLEDAEKWLDYHVLNPEAMRPSFDPEDAVKKMYSALMSPGSSKAAPRKTIAWQQKAELQLLFEEANQRFAADQQR